MTAAASVAVHGQMYVTTGRDTLRGLTGVEVMIEELQPELVAGGLTRTGLTQAIERRLRRAGIQVYASQKENPSPAKPYLYLHLNALEIPGSGLVAIAVQLQVRQTLQSPVTASNVVNAVTWDAHNVVGAPVKELAAVQQEIESYVDMFIEDWRAVH